MLGELGPRLRSTSQANLAAAGTASELYASTITFDCTPATTHLPSALAGNPTLAVVHDHVGQTFDVILKQDATGSRTVTWWSGILWAGGSAPTLTTAANKRDWFRFLKLSTGTYLGTIVGQNF